MPSDKPPKLVLVESDDWAGLYIDGKLARQGHEITLHDLYEIGLIPKIETREADYEWMEGRSDLPEKLSKVKFEG